MLLAFDIDGTLLLKAFVEHREALHEALRTVYGLRDPETARVEAAGRTDGEIARLILMQSGVSAARIDARASAFRAAACAAYGRRCDGDLSSHVAPGMGELVADLAGRDDVRLALVTGNLEPIARVKLRAAGIGRHFEPGQGGFGSDDEDRTRLPEIARRRAGRDGRPWPRERTAIIGDTPRDIACARADGVRAIAVATGPFRAEDLAEADAVARDAGELRTILEALLEAERDF